MGRGCSGMERTVDRLGAVWERISCRTRIATDRYLLPIPEGMIAVVRLVDRGSCG